MTYTDSILYADIFTYLPEPSKNDTIPFSLLIEPEVILPVIEKKAFIADWSVLIILLLLILLASVKIGSTKYLIHLIQSIFNRQTALRLFRENLVNLLHPSVRLEIIFYLTSGLFLFHIELYYLGS
ncbi:MAG: hypothetical protein JXR22_10425, partial [Prolixibacteraceae bacterium]|nr:hypothetical protein [Prolixibacteraceae bacterium]